MSTQNLWGNTSGRPKFGCIAQLRVSPSDPIMKYDCAVQYAPLLAEAHIREYLRFAPMGYEEVFSEKELGHVSVSVEEHDINHPDSPWRMETPHLAFTDPAWIRHQWRLIFQKCVGQWDLDQALKSADLKLVEDDGAVTELLDTGTKTPEEVAALRRILVNTAFRFIPDKDFESKFRNTLQMRHRELQKDARSLFLNDFLNLQPENMVQVLNESQALGKRLLFKDGSPLFLLTGNYPGVFRKHVLPLTPLGLYITIVNSPRPRLPLYLGSVWSLTNQQGGA